jgi:ParB family chromosome partitioning protein
MKLELAIIENIQREDLNSVDRARAFDRLAKEFGFKHAEIGKKVGKSREYVSNTLRLLMLPEAILDALSEGKITEGHARPLMMLVDRPEEQETLFKEIMFKKLNVRDAEGIARRIAFEKARKQVDPEVADIENRLKESLGTRVRIEKGKDEAGKITIDFVISEVWDVILSRLMMEKEKQTENISEMKVEDAPVLTEEEKEVMSEGGEDAMEKPLDEDEGLYSVTNFTV